MNLVHKIQSDVYTTSHSGSKQGNDQDHVTQFKITFT